MKAKEVLIHNSTRPDWHASHIDFIYHSFFCCQDGFSDVERMQSCKMDCENCDNCEIANCDCEEIAISQKTQFDFEKASQFRK